MRFEAGDELEMQTDVEFEERLTRALVAAPKLEIAGDFSARVAMRARSEGVQAAGAGLAERRAPGYGRLAIYLALPVLVVVMVLLARYAPPLSFVTLGIEGLTVVEFAGLAMYLAMRPGVVTE